MDPSVPEDLVRDDVAHARDERLIHQSRFHSSTPSLEQLEELPAPDGQRVRPQWPQDVLHLTFIVGQPDPSELAHVPVAELPAAGETYRQPIVPVAFGLFPGPDQVPGHAEVQEERRPVGSADQPFPVTIGIPEHRSR